MDTAKNSRPEDPIKFRQSCDRCQDSKVRCSRDKPVCKRCAQRRYHCSYSLARRTGRPRKIVGADAEAVPSSPSGMDVDEGQGTTPKAATRADTTISAAHQRSTVPPGVLQNDAPMLTPPFAYDARNDLSDCYTEVLAQTSRLERRIKQSTSPPTIDVVLAGEGAFRHLQQQIRHCRGHAREPAPQEPGPRTDAPTAETCWATGRPVLLSLALLAERIVGLLEDMFRLAAHTARSVDQASDFGWFAAPSSPLGLSARRSQRSLRNFQNQPCPTIEVESYRALRLDGFVVQGQANIDAMGRILKRRVARMLRTLDVLDRETHRTLSERQREHGQPPAGPLSGDSSMPLLDTMAGTLLTHLVRRMESLQGAMVLI